jgi:hypothetical protein
VWVRVCMRVRIRITVAARTRPIEPSLLTALPGILVGLRDIALEELAAALVSRQLVQIVVVNSVLGVCRVGECQEGVSSVF